MKGGRNTTWEKVIKFRDWIDLKKLNISFLLFYAGNCQINDENISVLR